MEKVPQIVRERLRVATPVGNHPDADVLTAFAEHSLQDQERMVVLEHLARCGDCREVVALALPESVPVGAKTVPSRGAWLSWPVLRWGFAVAGVVVIASLGVVQYRRQAAPEMAQKGVAKFAALAKNQVAAPQPAAAVKEPAPSGNQAGPTPAAKEQDKAQVSDAVRTDTKKAIATLRVTGRDEAPTAGLVASGSGAGVRTGLLPHGPKVAYQNQSMQAQNNAFVANALSAPAAAPPLPPAQGQLVADSRVPARSQAAQVQVEAGAPAIEANKLDLQNQPLSNQAANDGYAESKVEKSKTAETLVTVGPTKVLANSESRSFDRLSASPRWAITSHGTLQRSYDQGASWQDVPVKGTAGGAAAGIIATRETAAPAKVAGLARAKDAKQKAASEAPTVFRAVAAFGSEVWAGGSAGRLYHSSDAGSDWVQVVPSSGNVTLTGDIVSLDFTDAQHGRVTTSTPEVWLTSDAGQTWQKQ